MVSIQNDDSFRLLLTSFLKIYTLNHVNVELMEEFQPDGGAEVLIAAATKSVFALIAQM